MPTRFLHDCRRTAARNLIRTSVPERVAMLLTGYKIRRVPGTRVLVGAAGRAVLEAVKGFRRLKGHADIPGLVAALRARDERLGLGVSVEHARSVSTEPPLNFNSRRDIPHTTEREARIHTYRERGGCCASWRESPDCEKTMSNELSIAILGGLIGGAMGVVGTLIASYYGPRKIEEWPKSTRTSD